jgi:hypothetical protein
MKLKLLRSARIRHEAGEIVEVSPAEAGFLLTTGSAEKVNAPETRETPEEKTAPETRETPEEKAAARETRTKKK